MCATVEAFLCAPTPRTISFAHAEVAHVKVAHTEVAQFFFSPPPTIHFFSALAYPLHLPLFLQVFVSVPTGVFAGIILSALVYVWQSKSTFKFEIFYDKDTDTKVRPRGGSSWRPFVTSRRIALKWRGGRHRFVCAPLRDTRVCTPFYFLISSLTFPLPALLVLRNRGPPVLRVQEDVHEAIQLREGQLDGEHCP